MHYSVIAQWTVQYSRDPAFMKWAYCLRPVAGRLAIKLHASNDCRPNGVL